MGEARSTSSLTVEDLEKRPRRQVEVVAALKDVEVKYGESCQLSMQGEKEREREGGRSTRRDSLTALQQVGVQKGKKKRKVVTLLWLLRSVTCA